MNKQRKIEIYNAMDSFLTPTDKPRSIGDLNQDRHLFVERMEKVLLDYRDDLAERIQNIPDTYEDNESRVFRTTIKEVLEIINVE